jgi:hypothetical protein
MRLDGPAYGQLSRALGDALRLEEFGGLARRLGWKRTEVIGDGATLNATVHAFIEHAEAQDAVAALITEAKALVPTNRLLQDVVYDALVGPARHVRPTRRPEEDVESGIVEAVLEAIDDRDELRSMLVEVDARAAAYWEESRTTSDNLRHCVAAAATDGWLLPLVIEASSRAPRDPRLRELEARLAPLAAPEVDPESWRPALQLCRLTGGFFMIDRKPLRASMERMIPADGNRVLVVRGDPRSGMSHSLRLIYHMREVCSFDIAEIDLEEASRRVGPRKSLTPRDLATEVVRALDYDDVEVPEKPPDKQWSAWIIDFKDSFEERAQRDDRPMTFLVLDAFHKVRLTQPSVDLVSRLSKSIGMVLPNLRLVLVGFTQDLPVGLRQARLLDQTGELTEQHLMEFFAKAFKESQVHIDPAEIARKTAEVLGRRKTAAPGWLDEMADRVARELPGT